MRREILVLMGVVAVALVVGTSVSGYPHSGSISDAVLAHTYGGWSCEQGCDPQSTGCGGDQFNTDCSAGAGSDCGICDSSYQDEACEDWGICSPLLKSCSTCDPNDSLSCGIETDGLCTTAGGLHCALVTHPGGNCADATQCTTYGGW